MLSKKLPVGLLGDNQPASSEDDGLSFEEAMLESGWEPVDPDNWIWPANGYIINVSKAMPVWEEFETTPPPF